MNFLSNTLSDSLVFFVTRSLTVTLARLAYNNDIVETI